MGDHRRAAVRKLKHVLEVLQQERPEDYLENLLELEAAVEVCEDAIRLMRREIAVLKAPSSTPS